MLKRPPSEMIFTSKPSPVSSFMFRKIGSDRFTMGFVPTAIPISAICPALEPCTMAEANSISKEITLNVAMQAMLRIAINQMTAMSAMPLLTGMLVVEIVNL